MWKKTTLSQLFGAVRLWCLGLQAAQICQEVELGENTTYEVIKMLQSILMNTYERLPLQGAVRIDDVDLLGSDGSVVAADEMRVGRRKKGYFGHKTCPQGDIIGAVEEGPEGRVILELMPKLKDGKFRMKGPPTADEVRPFASTWIQPGSTVHTDGARAYEVVAAELAWTHHAVSHKRGEWTRTVGTKKVHTNKIDGLWAHVRGFINARFGLRKHRLEWYMREFEWRYNTSECLFASICDLINKRVPSSPPRQRSLNMGSRTRTPNSDPQPPRKRALSGAPAPRAKRRL